MSETTLSSAVRRQIDHPRFKEIYDILRERMAGALAGKDTKITWIIGPSHIGKTQLARSLAHAYKPEVASARKKVPVLFAPAKTATTTKLLPAAVLKALGGPYRQTGQSSGALTDHMYSQLRLAECKGILFDEASQVVEPGARVLPFAASEWFKQLDNDMALAQVLLGLPRLNDLFSANQQLRNRSYTRIVWMPYDISVIKDQDNYVGAVNTFLEGFRSRGWSFSLPLEVIVSNCYLFAPGLVGHLSELMYHLADRLEGQEPRAIGMADFQMSADALEGAGDPNYPAFRKELVPMSELHTAYQYVLASNGF